MSEHKEFGEGLPLDISGTLRRAVRAVCNTVRGIVHRIRLERLEALVSKAQDELQADLNRSVIRIERLHELLVDVKQKVDASRWG